MASMEGEENDNVSSSPNKRQKTTTQPLSSSKGKEKIIEIEDESENESMASDQTCGICFEEGKSIRGWIDSCNHYFCFVCIMEWSKVESRCPLCKQRFKTILRKPKDGIFLQERIVHVPLRNQVCDSLGNITTEVNDPYGEVSCTECRNSSDDHLLLLCDLCDSAAHTYCVGLGHTVPEGDWYCRDCTLLRNEHSSDSGNQDLEIDATNDCAVCRSSSDDHLLLLCDFCDSAAHTYCVGLGHTVPEGDWFCRDCSLLRNEQSSDTGNQDLDMNVMYDCTVCESSLDDHLLLLCDLCDSAAHTYCVGLGHTVPEGDWFCRDCTLLRNEQSSDTGNQDSDISVTTVCDVTDNSIAEMVRESHPRNVQRSTRRKTLPHSKRSSARKPGRNLARTKRSASRARGRNLSRTKRSASRAPGRSLSRTKRSASRAPRRNLTSTSAVTTRPDQLSSRVSGRDVSSSTAVTDSSARTLSHCRNVHSRIRILRQNWGALRNGSVSFSTNVSKSNGKNDKKRGTAVSNVNSSELQSSSSMNCKGNPANDNASGGMLNNKNPYDVNRAWKMLDIAKSVQIASEARRSSNQGSNHQPTNRDLTKASRFTSSTISLSKSEIVPQKDVGRIAPKKEGCQFVEMPQQEHRSQVLEEMRPKKNPMGTPSFQRPPTTCTLRACELPSVKQVHILDQVQPCHRNGCDDTRASSNMNRKPDIRASSYSKEELPPVKQVHILDQVQPCHRNGCDDTRASSNMKTKPDVRASSYSKEELPPVKQVHTLDQVQPCHRNGCDDTRASSNMNRKPDLRASSYSKEELCKEGGVAEIRAKMNARKDEGAKSEVQSLVKLNLKLLVRDKPLGVNGFKEVARLATHTVLAACGLEHKESSVRPFPNSICKHKDTTKQLRMSNLMPTSCRECFYGFVKDVVSSIVAQETALTK